MIILHGENIVLSRKELDSLIKDLPDEVVRLDGHRLSLADLKQAVESRSLFGKDRLVVLENHFSRRPSQEKEAILSYLKKNQPKNLILWEGKTIDGRSLTAFKRARVKKFSLTPFIFKFLETLRPGNQKESFNLLHRCLKQDPPEMVFFMLTRQIRSLIIACDLGEKGLTRLAPWQKSKLIKQAKQFRLEKLLWLHQQLLKIDFDQKTGQAILPLADQLDLLIASL